MNRPLIITIGIIIIFLVFGVWVFLFLFGAPESPREVFSELGIVENIDRPEGYAQEKSDNDVLLSLNDASLQQLTTASIAGFGVATSGAKTIIRYVEQGTGHVFEVDLSSGIQTQISGTTIPKTIKAIFSPNLSVIVFTTEEDTRKVIVGEIPKNMETDLQRLLLPSDAKNIIFDSEDKVHYTRTNAEQTIGYLYDITTQNETQEFIIDIPDLQTIRDEGRVYVYTKPTQYLDGFVYEIKEGTLSPVGEAGLGLIPFIQSGTIILNEIDKETKLYQTKLLAGDISDATIPALILPEKCVVEKSGTTVWCGFEFQPFSSSYLENWYKGIYSPKDNLWKIELTSKTATLFTVPKDEIGRNIDVINMTLSPNEEQLLFINKADNTLWLYKI